MNKLLALVALIVIVGFVYMQFGPDTTETVDVSEDSSVAEQTAIAEEEEIVAAEPAATDASSGTAVAAAGDATLGGELYNQYCVNCHGDGGAGLATFNGELERVQFMLNGGSAYMPDFTGMFTDEEISNIHAFLTSNAE